MKEYKITSRQYISRDCLVCGTENPFGLHAEFYQTEGGELIGRFRACETHQSYPGRLHGGICASILDETMGRAISVKEGKNIWGVTIDMNLKYRLPVPYDVTLHTVGRITNDYGRWFEATAELILPGGQVAVSSSGKFLKQSAERIIGEMEGDEEKWVIEKEDELPETITV